MKFTVAVLLLLLLTLVGYLMLGSAPAGSTGSSLRTEDLSRPRAVDPPTQVDRVHVEPAVEPMPGLTTAAAPNEATLRWREDPEILASIKQDFESSYQEKIDLTVADAEARRSGDFAIRQAIARSGATEPGLQLREEDFASLTQNQMSNLGRLLRAVADKSSEIGHGSSATYSREGVDDLSETLMTTALYHPPETVLEVLGIGEKLKNPDFARQVRALRVQVYIQAAPHLADLYNTSRFALGAAMRAGVDPTTFDFHEDAALITRLVREQQLQLEALSREFVLRCDEIGSRFD